jgi:hypothetical protein
VAVGLRPAAKLLTGHKMRIRLLKGPGYTKIGLS